MTVLTVSERMRLTPTRRFRVMQAGAAGITLRVPQTRGLSDWAKPLPVILVGAVLTTKRTNMWHKFDVKHDNQQALEHVIAIALLDHKSVRGWAVKDNALVFYWCEGHGTPFPVAIDQADDLAKLVRTWLEREAKYSKEPGADGSIRAGFRVSCDDWGHVDEDHYACIRVQPQWIVYGK